MLVGEVPSILSKDKRSVTHRDFSALALKASGVAAFGFQLQWPFVRVRHLSKLRVSDSRGCCAERQKEVYHGHMELL